MPFCPKCRDEFREGVETCPDCKVALVERLPPLPSLPKRPKEETDLLVFVATAPNEALAGMWADILKQNGINALIKRKPFLAPYQLFAFNEPCEIHVLASHASEAKQILEPFADIK